jgi:hypothetical protein
MKVSLTQLNNPYLQRAGQVQKQQPVQQFQANTVNASIDTNEVKFFQKLFPANAQQIENYVAFNRNGNVITTNSNKGSLLDARV